jgi:hypothetical protein
MTWWQIALVIWFALQIPLAMFVGRILRDRPLEHEAPEEWFSKHKFRRWA